MRIFSLHMMIATSACTLLLSSRRSDALLTPSSPVSKYGGSYFSDNMRSPTSSSIRQLSSPLLHKSFSRIYHPAASTSSTSLQAKPSCAPKGFELWNLFYDDLDLATSAWDWTANIGAPAALVAGAVLVTLSETREETAPRKHDFWWVRKAKMTMRFLLLSSFALEVISIFVSTMTGSVLLGHGVAKNPVGYQSALQLPQHHHE